MSEEEDLQLARDALHSRVVAIVGEGPIARFDEALTHPSFANERAVPDNQRLEFLGDAVLGLCVSELLIGVHATADEGQLTRIRSAIVNAEALAGWGRRAGVGPALALGRGARAGGERDQTNVIADAVEALVAAVYDARGIDGARALARDIAGAAAAADVRDPKSLLQERVQARGLPTPAYRVASSSGPQHAQTFTVEVLVGDDVWGRGDGRSKRLAEREAAADALKREAAADASRPEPSDG